MNTFEKITEDNKEVAVLRNEVKSLRAQKELHESSMKEESVKLIENEASLSEEEKRSLRESVSKSNRISKELAQEIEKQERELKKLEELYGIRE